MLQQAFDCVFVADVERDAIQHDVVRIEDIENRQDIGIGEDVEAVLMKENVPAMAADSCRQRRGVLRLGLDDQGVAQRGLGNLPLTGRTAQAMRRKRLLPIGRRRDLRMLGDVIVRARHDANAVAMRVVGQFLQIGDKLLGVRHVQLAVRLHEVVLRIHVPEDDAGRAGHESSPRKGRQPGNLSGKRGECQLLRRTRYSVSATATSSQACWRGQRAQSAQTLSGNCSFSTT